ncbi:hypothetical protein DERP_008638 [Dermatophagoides pteronyssinus]|uniref:Uncharacterized protein n=1 Tax=Dermatophagoides pteronyssinus TaxID=6956 RepID=A0ABQ8IWY9_DERPT|nr:hypothetical protein DERP_008638 [Dermatophagoides pteronyssinus]
MFLSLKSAYNEMLSFIPVFFDGYNDKDDVDSIVDDLMIYNLLIFERKKQFINEIIIYSIRAFEN